VKPPGYRPDIDGLRAVAILAVVLYHAGLPGFEAGYLGVDVFFVISGFLITGQLLREGESTGSIGMAEFYARRIRRLLPAFLVMAVGTSLLALVFLLPIGEQALFGGALSRSAAFYYNIAVWRGGYDYAARLAQEQVLMHTWSLGVEEQFYLIWPTICLIALRLRQPLVTFGVLVVASLVSAWWVLPWDAGAVFFLLPFRVWELGLGACLAVGQSSTSLRSGGWAAVGGLGLLGAALLSREPPGTSFWAAVLVTTGTALTTAFGTTSNPASALLRSAPMVLVGRMSYAWYLWHWPLLVISRLTTVYEKPLVQTGALVISFVLAVSTYFWIERPMRAMRIRNPVKVLGWGIGVLVGVATLGRAIEYRSQRLMEQPELAAQSERLKGAPSRPCDMLVSSMGCDISAGPQSEGPALLLWGDSFARALSPALEAYSRNTGSRVRLFVQPSCPPLLGVVPGLRTAPSKPDLVCQEALRSLQGRLRSDRSKIGGVILAARWPGYLSTDNSREPGRMYDWSGKNIEGSLAIRRGLVATLDFLETINVRVVIIGIPPGFPFDVPKCLLRIPTGCSVDRSWNESARRLSSQSIEEAIRGRPHTRFVELFDHLCPGARCSAGTLEEPLLADRTHLSAFAAERWVTPIVARHLDWLLDRSGAAPRPNGPE